jgi:hypothetical protein
VLNGAALARVEGGHRSPTGHSLSVSQSLPESPRVSQPFLHLWHILTYLDISGLLMHTSGLTWLDMAWHGLTLAYVRRSQVVKTVPGEDELQKAMATPSAKEPLPLLSSVSTLPRCFDMFWLTFGSCKTHQTVHLVSFQFQVGKNQLFHLRPKPGPPHHVSDGLRCIVTDDAVVCLPNLHFQCYTETTETTKTGKSHPALGLFGCLFVDYLHLCELAICRFISQECTTLTP